MLLLCFKIFLARILDVSIGTFRTMAMVKGKKFYPAILAFFEVLIWFYAAREALATKIDSILIPISYSLGYATGSYVGTFLSEIYINNLIGVQIITNKIPKMIKEIKQNGYGVTIIDINNNTKQQLLYIQINSKNLKKLKNIINRYDSKAFLIVNDTKYINNGWVK